MKPFVVWLETTEPLGSLVVQENEVPETQFGVCPLKIVDGELLDRTSEEMEVFELEFLQSSSLLTDKYKIKLLDGITFSYGGKTYPMHETARLYYHTIDKYRFGTHKNVRSLTGVESISVDDIDDFLQEYYKVVEGTLMPTI